MKDLTKALEEFINGYSGSKPITLAMVAKANNCSVDQVRRRAGGLVKAKKETFKNPVKNPVKKPVVKKESEQNSKIDNSILIKIMGRLDKMESKLDSILSDEWIKNTGDAPPDDRLCKVRYCDGRVKTALSEHLDWETRENFVDSMIDDLESQFMKECDDNSFDISTSETYKLFPEFKGYDLFFEGGWTYSFESEEDRRFRDAVYKRREIQEKVKHKLFDSGIEEYKRSRFEHPDESLFISEYKIMDDSNSRVMDKLAVIGRKIDSLK